MSFNPMQILSKVRQGQNPAQVMLQFLESQTIHSPINANLLNLAKQGNTAEIERVARNICAQRGTDFDSAFNSFKQMLGIK